MKSLIIGASAGLGRALAEELASRKQELVLVASDVKDLQVIAKDLEIRFQIPVEFVAMDLSNLQSHDLELIGKLQVKNLFYIAGFSILEKDFESLSMDQVSQLIQINFESAVKIIMAALRSVKSNQGCIVGIGSVAQARARRSNTVYAASKSALEFFFRGLRHSLAQESVQIQFYRVGFMDTSLNTTDGLIPKAPPSLLAKVIANRLQKTFYVRYLPFWWKWIMLVYQCLPWFIFKKMK